MEKTSRKRLWLNILAGVLLLAGNLLLFLTIWLANKYDDVSLDQFVYQMKTSAAGANRSLANSAIVRVGVFGVVLTLIEILVYAISSGALAKYLKKWQWYVKFSATKLCRFITKTALPIGLVMLIIGMSFFTMKLDFIDYVSAITTESDFIEENYVDPLKADLTFPEEKRNLIYIFLESMENTFAEPEAGGAIIDNFIPELTALAENNVNFSHDDDLGGALSFMGTTWTAAAMVTQTSGMVVQVPLTATNYGGSDPYMPGLVSIGEVLEREGYNQSIIMGSDGDFAGRESYFVEHGNYKIIDTKSLKADGTLPEDYNEWWGFEDEKVFAYAKEELIRLAAEDEPFNFTLLTCDTHFPSGYVCELCDTEEFTRQYPNVLHCSSKQVTAFVEWIQAQDFYKNTTIVISGDHLTMDPKFLKGVDENYTRTIYNCIINAAVEPINEKNRQFGTFDMLPTTLAAMGVQIEGERLGIGTNLFSATPTFAEVYGYEELNDILQQKSTFYNETFLDM